LWRYDGINPPLTFEFEESSTGPAGVSGINRPIVYALTDSADVLAAEVARVIDLSIAADDLIDLMPTNSAGSNVVALAGATSDTSLDTTLAPDTLQMNPVSDGHTLSVDPDGAGGVAPTLFEFDSGGGATGTPIPFNLGDTANDIANSNIPIEFVLAIIPLFSTPLSLGLLRAIVSRETPTRKKPLLSAQLLHRMRCSSSTRDTIRSHLKGMRTAPPIPS